MTVRQKLPPTDRDLEIFELVQICGTTTRAAADMHELSQTRVRQIVSRVAEWIAEVLPPQTKVEKEKEVLLARRIAADRYQHQFEQMTICWRETRQTQWVGPLVRIINSQARLGVVAGKIDGLVADVLEGTAVETVAPEESSTQTGMAQGAVSADSNSEGPPPGDARFGSDDPDLQPPIPELPSSAENQPPTDPPPPRNDVDESTARYINFVRWFMYPEDRLKYLDVLAQADHFLSPQERHKTWAYEAYRYPESCSPNNPLPRDCSAWQEFLRSINKREEPRRSENVGAPASYDHHDPLVADEAIAPRVAAQDLLTPSDQAEVLEMQVTPQSPGVVQRSPHARDVKSISSSV
jgi:hypothetical protein